MRILPRRVEGVVGEALISHYMKHELKKAGLVQKKVWLPKHKLEMHYLERLPSTRHHDTEQHPSHQEQPAIVFLHGIADRGQSFAGFISALDVPPNVRLVIPDMVGHGKDLERALDKNDNTYQHPTPQMLLTTTSEFLDCVHVSPCHVVGASMGGALAYWLRKVRPDVVQKSVLIAPALEPCLRDDFLQDFISEKKPHFCFTTRSQLKVFFRDLNYPKSQRRDPVPKFFLQAIVRQRKRTVPPNHFHEMMHTMLQHKPSTQDNNKDDLLDLSLWTSPRDVDPTSPRLVLWPDCDYICSHAKGQAYFEESASVTCFETLENCGHAFVGNGLPILPHVAPRVSQYLFEN